MESSKVPLTKWALAFHLMTASKKGMSAHQMHRMLKVAYNTAWFMEHRIREAMTETDPAPLGGEGKVVEADETYHGKRETPVESPARKGRPFTKSGKSGGAMKRPIVSAAGMKVTATVLATRRLSTADGTANTERTN